MKLTKETILSDIARSAGELRQKLDLAERELPSLAEFFAEREMHFCYFYPKYTKIICGVATREDFAPIRALHVGVWDKDVQTSVCTYRCTLASGIILVCEVSELPPSCKLVEETFVVPAMPEHTVTKVRVICPKTKEEHGAASEASLVENPT